jgi:pantothenate kinase-related protein Tda10
MGVGIAQEAKQMVKQPKTSRYQLVASMTAEELLSEGYVSLDDLYDPNEEREKKALIEEKQQVRESGWQEEGEEF